MSVNQVKKMSIKSAEKKETILRIIAKRSKKEHPPPHHRGEKERPETFTASN
jgi:hypothetical protein